MSVDETGIPLPEGSREIDPAEALTDLPDPDAWRVLETPHSFDGLHAFYTRELPAHEWQIESLEAFSHPHDPGFSRMRLSRGDHVLALGLLPYRREAGAPDWLGRIAIKVG